MTLAERIINISDLNTLTAAEKMQEMKRIALDEIRMQALKAVPAKAKFSTTLTKIYKENHKRDSNACYGYVKMPAGFAIPNAHFMIYVEGDPLDLLPVDAMEDKKLTAGNVNHVLKSVEMHDKHDIKVNYSDIVTHIKTHGRKKTNANAFFTVPGTEYSSNVFHLEYAFKLAGEKELTFSVKDPRSMWCLHHDNWSMLIVPMFLPDSDN